MYLRTISDSPLLFLLIVTTLHITSRVIYTSTFLRIKNLLELLSIYTQIQQIEYTKEKGGVTRAVSTQIKG